MKTRLLELLAALLITGCAGTTGTDSMPEDFSSPPPPAAVPPVRPAVPEGRLTLEDAIRLARRRNPDLKIAAERIDEARGRLEEVTSAFYPQVGARLSYVGTDNPAQAFGMIVGQREFTPGLDVNDPGSTTNVRPEIVARYSLYAGGRDASLRRAAEAGVDVRTHQARAVENLLAASVTNLFYAVLAAGEQVEVARNAERVIEAELAQVRVRFEQGAALKSDVLSLEVRLASAREGFVQARNAVQVATAGLRMLLAAEGTERIEPVASPGDAAAAVPPDVEEAVVRAGLRRPEAVALSRVVAMRGHQVEAERSAHWPRLEAFGSYGHDADNLDLGADRDNWTVGIQLEFDLFSGFRTRGRVKAATHRLGQAKAALRKLRLSIEQEVRTAHASLSNALERERVAAKAIGLAGEAHRLVTEQYRAGTVTVTRYLDAEAALAAARSRRVAAGYDVRRARAALRKAMGESR